MVLVGLVWIAMNFFHMPLYGDSVEYIALSKSMKVDQYRGIVYPFIIHLSDSIAYKLNIKGGFTSVLYVGQLFLLFGSSIIFSISLLKKISNGLLSSYYAVLCGLIVSFNPLSIHFALTVLTDSLSASLVLLQATCLISATDRNISFRSFSIWILLAGLVTIILSNLRIDKFYLSALVFIVFWIYLLMNSRLMRINKKIVLVTLIFIATFGAVSSISSSFTFPNPERPELSLSTSLFNRAVWPRLSKILAYLPDNIADTITKEQAEKFDSDNNNVFPFQVDALRDSTKGVRYLNTITVIAVERFYPEIIGTFFFDFAKYLLPSFAFPLEVIGVLPRSFGTGWTISRASMVSPKVTAAYLFVGSVFYFVVIGLAIVQFNKFVHWPVSVGSEVLIIALYIIGNSALFAFAFGMNAHIRYSLPTYILTLNFLLIFIFYKIKISR